MDVTFLSARARERWIPNTSWVRPSGIPLSTPPLPLGLSKCHRAGGSVSALWSPRTFHVLPSRWGAPSWELNLLVVGVWLPDRSCCCQGAFCSLLHCGVLCPQVTMQQATFLLQTLVNVTFAGRPPWWPSLSPHHTCPFFIALNPASHFVCSPVHCLSSAGRMRSRYPFCCYTPVARHVGG